MARQDVFIETVKQRQRAEHDAQVRAQRDGLFGNVAFHCDRRGRAGYAQRSRMAVTPIPPAVHTEISPRLALLSFASSFARLATMRVPGRRERMADRDAAAFHVELGAVDAAERRRAGRARRGSSPAIPRP